MRETVASRAQARFDMSEREYLLSRIQRGYTAGGIAREIGMSREAVTDRLKMVAQRNPYPWIPLPSVAA